MSWAIAVAVAVASVVVLVYASGGKIRRDGRALPRPPHTLPLLGNAFWFLQARHVLLDWFVQCERRFGLETFEISVPTLPPGVVVSDPRNLEYVLKNDETFSKGSFFKQRSWDLFGNGIINVDGPLWKLQRKAALPFFSTSNLHDLIEKALPSYVARLKIDLRAAAEDGRVIDLEHSFLKLTTRFVGNLAYNMDIDASDPFSSAFDFASGAVGERFQNPLWKLTEPFVGGRLRAAISEVKSFGRTIVNSALQTRQGRDDKSVCGEAEDVQSRGKLIDSLIDALEEPEAVADAALNFLSAGRDTTAQALTWTFYQLMRNPQAVRLIREELSGLLANGTFSPHGIPSLDFEHLQPSSLPYISAVFNESLRLYPPVPIEIKQCERATTLPDGTFLPQGAIVVWCVWAINRSRELWGDEALLFRPERWLDGFAAGADDPPDNQLPARNLKLRSKTAFEFPVFNGGPRTCMGKRLAELQAAYIMASLVWDFDFAEADTSPNPPDRISRNSLTLPMEGGLPCRVTFKHA